MSIILNPTISTDLNQNETIRFDFAPTLTQPPYVWNENPIHVTSGTNNYFIYPSIVFPGFDGTAGTNFVALSYQDEVLLFKPTNPIRNILEWLTINDLVTGDTDFLSFDREFRYSYDNYRWSNWMDLTLDNLNISAQIDIFVEFRYTCLALDRNFSFSVHVDQPPTSGWNKVFDGTNFYQFDRDFPTQGTYGFTINSQKLSPNAILFGTDLLHADAFPNKGDFIFLNPLFDGITLTGNNTLNVTYTERSLPNNYVKRLYLNNLIFTASRNIEATTTIFDLLYIGDQRVLQIPFILKAFRFTGYQIAISGETTNRTLDIQYRYSNNKKTWSKWEPFTQENFSTVKPDPLGFFYIEFTFTRTGTDSTGKIGLRDIIFDGDFRNVTNDYQTIKKFGLRCDCDYSSNVNSDDSQANAASELNNASDSAEVVREWATSCPPTFNPYNVDQSLSLYNKLANDVSTIFGWNIDYYRVSPDGAGKDFTLHEYQLYNVVDKCTLKVLVPDNKFPENIIQFNTFDLSLFESFEIHITKEEFHNVFGINNRPAKKDFIFFCALNRVYRVEHSQMYRNFMNSSVYYKVVLTKYQNDVSIDNREQASAISDLIKDNSLDLLMGDQVQLDTNKIADKTTQENLTEDATRLKIISPITDFELLNGPNVIATNYYNFINETNNLAVTYQKIDTILNASDNRAFMCWFNIQNYVVNQDYNFIDNRRNGNGYRIGFKDGKLIVLINSLVYNFDISVSVGNWYGIIANFDQRQHEINWSLYKIYSSTKPGTASSSELELVETFSDTLDPQTWNDSNMTLKIYGSPLLYSNMRIFSDVIPLDKQSKLLNQYIVKDTSKLILADNVNKIVSPNRQHPY